MSGLSNLPDKGSAGAMRSRSMQVLSLGMSRTGTQTMAVALRQLGYGRVYHGHDMGDKIEDVRLWRSLWQRKQRGSGPPITASDFDEILGECEAVTDSPCALFWSELMDSYPDAKVVLVLRDTESWYQSFASVCIDPYCSKRSRLLSFAVRLKVFPYNVLVFLPELFMGYFRAENEDEFRKNARSIYEEHNAAIIARAKNEGRQILQMRLSKGWKPLCKYLKKPLPSTAFPRSNDAASLRALTYKGYTMLSSLAALSFAAIIGLLSTLIWNFWTSIR